ncbi:alpha/beta hydrolase [Helcococcus ovis]|uniref:alpha/beta fold hydrolase n=1 Tax=Helcococcus ovis TaxID=72026 RepID=UPI0038BD0456
MINMKFNEFNRNGSKSILLLPGYTKNKMYQENIISALKSNYHIIVPNISECMEYDIEEVISQIKAYLNNICLNKIELVIGSSLGGHIAIRLLLDSEFEFKNVMVESTIYTEVNYLKVILRLAGSLKKNKMRLLESYYSQSLLCESFEGDTKLIICYGEKDSKYVKKTAKILKKVFSNSLLFEFKGYGHCELTTKHIFQLTKYINLIINHRYDELE